MPRRPLRFKDGATPTVRALPRRSLGQRPNEGHSPTPFIKNLAARHSLASHQAAKPGRLAQNGWWFVEAYLAKRDVDRFASSRG